MTRITAITPRNGAAAAEFLLLFGATPLVLLWLVPHAWWPWLLAAAAALCAGAWLVRGPCMRRCWLRPLADSERRLLPRIATRLGLCAIALGVLIATLAPERLFNLPRENTVQWLALLAGYPLFSVLPQEVMYRYVIRCRYRRLFAGRWEWPSAIAFAWLHVAFANAIAPLLCLVGGRFFAGTYRRSRSLRLAVAEHTLYGALVFSVGLGDYFFHAGPRLFRVAE